MSRVRTRNDAAAALLEQLQKDAEQKTYNIADDLRQLLELARGKSHKDLVRVLEGMVAKYETGEYATVHAALVERCKAGDVNAMRLYNEQRAPGVGHEEVRIIDDV